MLYSKSPAIADSSVVIEIHVPRTGGTSIRLLFNELFGSNRCLASYNGELEQKRAEQLEDIRFVAGHFAFGAHRYFTREARYISVIRDPIDRYLSTYAEFKTNPNSKYHQFAVKYDINDFLMLCLDGKIPGLLNQQNNLQCRLICGHADFQTARQYIDNEYYLVAPFLAINEMAALILAGLNRSSIKIPHVHQTQYKMAALSELASLSSSSLDIILDSEREDALLYSYVQKAFSAISHALPSSRIAIPAPKRPEGSVSENIPPQSLRFMGESDDVFLTHADYLANHVLKLAQREPDTPPRNILDVGCGYGRLAYGLRRQEYCGKYEGFDILMPHIDWLNDNFIDSRGGAYSFRHVNIYNERYNPKGNALATVTLPYATGEFDTLVSLSVFTHLYEDDLSVYFKRLAELVGEGGIWVATFFSIPEGFSLDSSQEGATFPLTKQISQNAYIHDPKEPLFVIAYNEAFLLKMFAKEGFEIISQRKGRWLTNDNALELQDWFVLRKRCGSKIQPTNLPTPSNHDLFSERSPGKLEFNSPISRVTCPICGGNEFGPGPQGRMAATGTAPCCMKCGSLERHRIVRQIFHALPIGFLDWRAGIQFSNDQGIDGKWFRTFKVSIYGGEYSIDLQQIGLPTSSIDFFSLNHVLESVKDDKLAFKELVRVLSPNGFIQICFGSPFSRAETIDLAEPQFEWKAHHHYGRDLLTRFNCRELDLTVVVIEETDRCTGVLEPVHFFFKNPADASRLRNWVSNWSETARILD